MGQDYGAILRDYENYQPKSWWTPSDQANIDLTRSTLATTATQSGRGASLLASRRLEARGMAGSPAEEATLQRISEGTALGREQAGSTAEVNGVDKMADKAALPIRSRC